MYMKKISVITVNYNNGDLLETTIKSVIEQTFSDYEYIVIDGGSTDNSVSIIEKYSDSISYWVSEKDKGIYNAMNKGITKAAGDYCLFINSGDTLYEKDTLEKAVEFLNADFISGGALVVEPARTWFWKPPATIDPMFFIQRLSLGHQEMFTRTELLKQRPYDESLKITADWEQVFYEILVNHRSYKVMDVIVCRYLLDGVSTNAVKSDAEKRMTLEKYRSLGYIPQDELLELVHKLRIGTRKYRLALAVVRMIVNGVGFLRKGMKR